MLQSTLKTERGKQRITIYCDIYLNFESPNEIMTLDKCPKIPCFPETQGALLVFSFQSMLKNAGMIQTEDKSQDENRVRPCGNMDGDGQQEVLLTEQFKGWTRDFFA